MMNCLIFISLFISVTVALRDFRLDLANNQFLRDGEPFRYVAGSLHYFRVPSIFWRDRLRKLRSAGLNAVTTYVEWNSHEKTPGNFDFSGDMNLIQFINIAAEEDLLVLLRPGPYICAEREMGGLPSWLLQNYPQMHLRTNDATYMSYVHRWLTVLMTRMSPLLYGNGGPIIMVQVENEYGSYSACDFAYTSTLKEIFKSHVGNAALLFTTDGNAASYLKCGKINGVYATVDFGASSDVNASFEAMRKFEPRGPLVNSEFYPGWLDHWGERHSTVGTASVVYTLDQMLAINASVNFYMFFGGTNFGFTAGADILESSFEFDNRVDFPVGANIGDTYSPQPTSYDYDAPLSEAGDPTPKYYAIRETVLKYLPAPPGEVPKPSEKGDYGRVQMKFAGSLFTLLARIRRSESPYPLKFEELGQWSGLVLYQTSIIKCFPDPALLNAPDMRDRAQVFVNKNFIGTLSRMQKIYNMPLLVVPGDELDILVENQGRVNYGSHINDFKGLLKNVTLHDKILTNWTMYQFPLESYGKEILLIDELIKTSSPRSEYQGKTSIPGIYWGDFVLPSNITVEPALDTFLDLGGWFKGIAFINGFNLGRYWSIAGPQRTLYLPGNLLKLAPNKNRIVLLELERAPMPCTQGSLECTVLLSPNPVLDTKCAIKMPLT